MSKKEIEIKTYRIPKDLACFIANDDPSGLTDNEIKEFDKFLDRITFDGFKINHITLGEDLGFCSFNDINDLGSDCIELIVFFENKV